MKGRRIAVDFSPMDFAQMARGMGCEGVRVQDAQALGDAMAAAHEANRAGRTVVIDVTVDPAASHVPVSDY
jgi:thiamine pyrophosphate-dependent acetolactate synthase large subunit-like protein